MAKNSSTTGRAALLVMLLLGSAAEPTLAQETPEQREACQQDTKRFCANAMPDIGRAVECLKAQGRAGRLSRRCRVALDTPAPVVPPSAPVAAPVAGTTPPVAPPVGGTPGPAAPPVVTPAAPRAPHLAFAPHWRYTLRKPQVPIARKAPARRPAMTPAQRLLAARRTMARRCLAAGRTYNVYTGTCGYSGYLGGFFQ